MPDQWCQQSDASSLREVVGGGLREQQGVFATDSLRKRLMRSVGLRAPWLCSSCDESVKKWRIRMTTLLSYRRTAFAAGLVISVLPIFAVALSPGVAGAATATSVSTGNNSSTCATNATDGVDCWGDNYFGQLGNNTTTQEPTPVAVLGVNGTGTLSGATSVSVGHDSNCATLSAGGVDCWGDNRDGELGNNSATQELTPVAVVDVGNTGAFLSGVASVSVGVESACAALTTGGVDCWGSNIDGDLGLGNTTTTNSETPVAVVGVGGTGTLSGVTSVSVGFYSTCATLSSGGVDCWGFNASGQLGNNSATQEPAPVEVVGVNGTGTLSGVTSVSANDNSTCATLTTGGVDCWGSNNSGQLGNNTTTSSETPVAVVGVSDSGTLSGVASASVGYEATCAMLSSGGVDCWGLNDKGQLGNNSATQELTPVAVATLASVLSTPAAPSISKSGTSVTVTYTADAHAASSTITLYNETLTTSATFSDANTGSHTFTGLIPGDSYRATITSVGDGTNYTTSLEGAISATETLASVPLSAPPTGPTNAPPPTSVSVPASSFGTPTSVTASCAAATTVSETSGGASETITVPQCALPSGTTVSAYQVINTVPLVAQVPAGSSYVLSFAVTWEAPNGTSPTATAPITMTITDLSIVAGDTIYELTSTGLAAVGTATANGTVTITFSSDPIFLVSHTTPVAQASLRITTLSGTLGTALTLVTSGGSGSGAVSFTVTNATATGCRITGRSRSRASRRWRSRYSCCSAKGAKSQ